MIQMATGQNRKRGLNNVYARELCDIHERHGCTHMYVEKKGKRKFSI